MSSPFRNPSPDKIILSGSLHGGVASEKISFQIDSPDRSGAAGIDIGHQDVPAPCYLRQQQSVWSRSTEETIKQRVGSCAWMWIPITGTRTRVTASQWNVGESCLQLQLLTGTKYKSGTAFSDFGPEFHVLINMPRVVFTMCQCCPCIARSYELCVGYRIPIIQEGLNPLRDVNHHNSVSYLGPNQIDTHK